MSDLVPEDVGPMKKKSPPPRKSMIAKTAAAVDENFVKHPLDPYGLHQEHKDAGPKVGETQEQEEERLRQEQLRDEIEEYRAVFDTLDVDGSGAIDKSELQEFFTDMGINMDKEDLEYMINQMDDDGSGEIEFNEFAQVLVMINSGVMSGVSQQEDDSPGEDGESAIDKLKRRVSTQLEAAAPTLVVQKTTRRMMIWEIMENPAFSPVARVISFTVMNTILVSCVCFCLESLPSLKDVPRATWYNIEVVCVVIFSVEYTVRIVVCPDKGKFLRGFMNTIDLIAILPFFIEEIYSAVADDAEGIGGGGSAVFRVVRLVRVFRIFKLSRYLAWVRMFAAAMARSAMPLAMVGFIMAIFAVIYSSAMYFMERGDWDPDACEHSGLSNKTVACPEDGAGRYVLCCAESTYRYLCDNTGTPVHRGTLEVAELRENPDRFPTGCSSWNTTLDGCYTDASPSRFMQDSMPVIEYDADRETQVIQSGCRRYYIAAFQSIPHAFWWCIITMTTVGYGDNFSYPLTTLGKTLGILVALSGIIILAVPLSVFFTNFKAEQKDMEQARLRAARSFQRFNRSMKSKRKHEKAVQGRRNVPKGGKLPPLPNPPRVSDDSEIGASSDGSLKKAKSMDGESDTAAPKRLRRASSMPEMTSPHKTTAQDGVYYI